MTIGMWIMLILGALVALAVLLVLLFIAFMFVVALIEKHRILALKPLNDSQAPSSKKAIKVDQQAREAGLLFLGVYKDDESALLKTEVSIYLSDDGITMMMLPRQARSLGFRLYSAMEDGVWLMTNETGGSVDLSGLTSSAMLPGCTVDQCLAYHRDRVSQYSAPPTPYAPERLVETLFEHERAQAERTVQMGYGKWTDPFKKVWKYNARGACKIILNMFTDMSRAEMQQDIAKRYKGQTGQD